MLHPNFFTFIQSLKRQNARRSLEDVIEKFQKGIEDVECTILDDVFSLSQMMLRAYMKLGSDSQ